MVQDFFQRIDSKETWLVACLIFKSLLKTVEWIWRLNRQIQDSHIWTNLFALIMFLRWIHITYKYRKFLLQPFSRPCFKLMNLPERNHLTNHVGRTTVHYSKILRILLKSRLVHFRAVSVFRGKTFEQDSYQDRFDLRSVDDQLTKLKMFEPFKLIEQA